MSKQGTILVVDDNEAILTAMRLLLENVFGRIVTISSPERIKTELQKEKPDVILLDMNFKSGINNGNEGLFWLLEIKRTMPFLPVVLFTAYADIELAVKGIKEGATDFVVKPWDNEKLVQTLLKAASSNTNTKGNAGKESAHSQASTRIIWGESKVMQQLRSLVEKVAVTDANILITGENGTGKEMLAREIHALSKRRKKIMVTVDMGAITETLFESELFGHVKGAFTDANADRPGKFETANQSSLFLDEIGNLPYHLQAKLLTILQSRSVVRVGSNNPIPVDIRLICATNKNLDEMVENDRFREDLLYRINTIQVKIPALRERREDIIRLAEVFLSNYCGIYSKQEMSLTPKAREKLLSHPWHGNIRELEHTIEKAVIIHDTDVLDDIAFDLNKSKGKVRKEISTLDEMEYEMIKETIDKFEGNMSLAAQQLGISRQTLYNKIKKHDL